LQSNGPRMRNLDEIDKFTIKLSCNQGSRGG
jgi:hypothetical protein